MKNTWRQEETTDLPIKDGIPDLAYKTNFTISRGSLQIRVRDENSPKCKILLVYQLWF
jgi:hypothetical protein